jgi:hypothetical protein
MSGMYFNPLKRVFLNLSGGTVTGDTVFEQGLTASTVFAEDVFFSAGTNLETIIRLLAANAATGATQTAAYLPLSGGTGGEYYFTGNTTGQTIYVENDFIPTIDNNSDIGSPVKRFRNLNIVNGIAVNFTAETRLSTIELKLGNTLVTENNIILSGYTLEGGSW